MRIQHWLVVLIGSIGLGCSGLLLEPGEHDVRIVTVDDTDLPLMVVEQGSDCVQCYVDCMTERPEDLDYDEWEDPGERSEYCEVYCVQNFGNFE